MGNAQSEQQAQAQGDEGLLIQAAQSGDTAQITALLAKRPDLIYAHSKDGHNVWHFAVRGGHAKVFDLLAKDVGTAQAATGVKKLAAGLAKLPNAALQNMQGVPIPMGRNLSIDAQDRGGRTPLMTAVEQGRLEAVASLLAHGASLWVEDVRGNTALHLAALAGQLKCAEALLEIEEAAQQQQQQQQLQPSAKGEQGDAKRLVAAPNHAGLTPLHFAAWGRQTDMAKMLLRRGADLLAQSERDSLDSTISCNGGSTPTHLAAMRGHEPLLRLFLRTYVKIVEYDSTKYGSSDYSDPRTIEDRFRHTPQQMARDCGAPDDIIRLLDPKTPLDIKTRGGGSSSPRAPGLGKVGSKSGRKRRDGEQETAAAATTTDTTAAEPAPGSSMHEPAAATAAPSSASPQQHGAAPPSTGPSGRGCAPAADPSSTTAVEDVMSSVSLHDATTVPVAAAASPPNELICPITMEVMKDPVTASDGRSYERTAIEVWLELGNVFFPGGTTRISSKQLTSNAELKARAATWRKERQQAGKRR